MGTVTLVCQQDDLYELTMAILSSYTLEIIGQGTGDQTGQHSSDFRYTDH